MCHIVETRGSAPARRSAGDPLARSRLECSSARARERALPIRVARDSTVPFRIKSAASPQRAVARGPAANPHSCRIASMHVMWKARWTLRYPIHRLNLARSCAGTGPPRCDLALTRVPGEAAAERCPGARGPFSQPRGESMQRAAELAVKEINARGGIRAASWRCGSWMTAAGLKSHSHRRAAGRRSAVVAVVGHLTPPSRSRRSVCTVSAPPHRHDFPLPHRARSLGVNPTSSLCPAT